jgi:hypothetical protein
MEIDYSKLNRTERVIKYLQENGSIEPIQAWKDLGIYRLSACILELRKSGCNIITKRKNSLNRFGESCKFACYVLKPNEVN